MMVSHHIRHTTKLVGPSVMGYSSHLGSAAGPPHAAFRLGIILDLVGIGEVRNDRPADPFCGPRNIA